MRNLISLVEAASAPLLYHVSLAKHRRSIGQRGLEPRAGQWMDHVWHEPRVYLATSVVGAYEFGLERRKQPQIIVVVDPKKVPDAEFHDDEFFDLGVWTASRIPPEAIVKLMRLDPAFYDSPEFLRHIGIEDQ